MPDGWKDFCYSIDDAREKKNLSLSQHHEMKQKKNIVYGVAHE